MPTQDDLQTDLIDTRYHAETPEGIDLHAQLAGPVPRGLALLIDLSIRTALYIGIWIVAALLAAFLTSATFGFALIFVFLVEWFYPVIFEVLWGGQTPGKRSLNLQVVHTDLTPISWSSSIIRNLLRWADFLPFFYISGALSILLTEHYQRLGDMAAGTLVVHKEPKPSKIEPPVAQPLAPTAPLAVDEQLAIIGFTERHQLLSQGRKQELANLLSPIHQLRDQPAVDYLHGLGRWLLGDQDPATTGADKLATERPNSPTRDIPNESSGPAKEQADKH